MHARLPRRDHRPNARRDHARLVARARHALPVRRAATREPHRPRRSSGRARALRRGSEILGLRDVGDLVELGRLARAEALGRELVCEREELRLAAAVVAERDEVGASAPRAPTCARPRCRARAAPAPPRAPRTPRQRRSRPRRGTRRSTASGRRRRGARRRGTSPIRGTRRAAARARFSLPEKEQEIALEARRVLELVDERDVERRADLGGDVGSIAQEVARHAEEISVAERGRAIAAPRATSRSARDEDIAREARRRGELGAEPSSARRGPRPLAVRLAREDDVAELEPTPRASAPSFGARPERDELRRARGRARRVLRLPRARRAAARRRFEAREAAERAGVIDHVAHLRLDRAASVSPTASDAALAPVLLEPRERAGDLARPDAPPRRPP